MEKHQKKTLIIIGGGFAGLNIANTLTSSKHYNTIVVDAKRYFEYVPDYPSYITDPSLSKKIHIDLRSHFGDRFLHGVASDVSRTHITLKIFDCEEVMVSLSELKINIDISENEEGARLARIPYDALVFCHGAAYDSPIRPKIGTDLSIEARNENSEILKNEINGPEKKLLVVGGGYVSLEIAC